jgi:hypothetical protein
MVSAMERVGDILANSPKLKRVLKKARPLTAPEEKFIEAATLIRMNPGDTEAAFMARELVQCTLPHSNPGSKVLAWKRTNGNLTLSIKPGSDADGNSFGYPYGVIPRLLLFWITTEAVQTKSRRLQLGHHLSTFMRELGLDPNTGGGRRSDARRLQEQMRRLFRATISFTVTVEEPHRTGEGWLDMQVAPEGFLWWDTKRPEQGALWGSWVELGEKFFKAITAWPVPVDMRVLRAIKKSPLALDLYAWVTWRVFRLARPAFIPWDGLMKQMGGEYKETRNFVSKAKAAFRKIQAAYPGLKLNYAKGGMILHPSLTAIAPAPKQA